MYFKFYSNYEVMPESYAYQNNLDELTSLSKIYFKENNLPTQIGTSITVTLEELISQSQINDFTENGTLCNTTNSYIKATKVNKKDHNVKIQLDCESSIEFIIITLD